MHQDNGGYPKVSIEDGYCRAEDESSELLDQQLDYLWYELDHHIPRTFTAVARARLILDQKRWRLVSTSLLAGSFTNYALVRLFKLIELLLFSSGGTEGQGGSPNCRSQGGCTSPLGPPTPQNLCF